jgi:DNA-binding CsgD family transcriptional regulator
MIIQHVERGGTGAGVLVPLAQVRFRLFTFRNCHMPDGLSPDPTKRERGAVVPRTETGRIRIGSERKIAKKNATPLAPTERESDMSITNLSAREREVLLWAAEGKTASETASILHVSASAVNLYSQRAMSKLQARTKTQAVAIALRNAMLLDVLPRLDAQGVSAL